ncbi:DUF4169 family protein [Shimia sp.]|uniref:DUF4169 family protein n=1 Tax=Shimia sp. TaxID=1954381 RepID=UPI003561F671
MAEPVNLNRFRKQKARAEKQARADQNAVKFGRSKAEKTRDRAQADKAARHLDGHRRDSGGENGRDKGRDDK